MLWAYIRAMGGIWRFGLLMSWFVLIEAARVGATVWLSHWTGAADQKGGAPHPALWYLAIYSGISGGQVGLPPPLAPCMYPLLRERSCCATLTSLSACIGHVNPYALDT